MESGPEHSAVYRDFHGLRITDSLQSAFLPLVALDSPATLRSGTGCAYHAHFMAELRRSPGVNVEVQGQGAPCVRSPRSLLVSHMQDLGPGEWLVPARAAERHSPIVSRPQAPSDQCPELLRHLWAKPQHMSPGFGPRAALGRRAAGGVCPGVSSAPQACSSLKGCDLLQHESLGEFELGSQCGPSRNGTGSERVAIESGAGGVTGAASGDSPPTWGSERSCWPLAVPGQSPKGHPVLHSSRRPECVSRHPVMVYALRTTITYMSACSLREPSPSTPPS